MSDIPVLHKVESDSQKNNIVDVSKELKEISNQTGFLTSTIADAKDITSQSTKLISDTLLGDVSFITKPVQEIKDIGSKFGGLFKKKKVNPKKNSLLASKDPSAIGAVYLGDKIEGAGDNEGSLLDKFKGIMPMLMGGAGTAGVMKLLKPLLPKLMMGGGIAMIAGSIIWMAIDGIRGALKAKDWGVSKTAGVIGGIFGGMGSGLSGAFKNMGKFALLGAGIGLVGGPVGVLAGGLIGAAIGGILGFIGGERIAKATQAVGDWFVKTWKKITGFFVNTFTTIKEGILNIFNSPIVQQVIGFVKNIFDTVWTAIKTPFVKVYDGIMDSVDKIKAIFSSDDSIGKKIGKLLVEVVAFVPKMLFNWFTGIWDGLKGLFLSVFTDQKQPDGKVKKGLVKQLWELIKNIGSLLGTKIKSMFFSIINGLGSIGGTIKDKIVSAVEAVPQVLIKAINSAGTFLSDMWSGIKESLQAIPIVGDIFNFFDEKIFQPLGNIFTKVKDGIANLIKDPVGYGKEILQKLLDSVKEIFVKVKEGFLTFLKDPLGTTKNAISSVGAKVGDVAGGAIDKFKSWFGGSTSDKSVNDAIIKTDGSIIRTNSNDTLIATKNPVAFADKEVNTNTPVTSSNSIDTLLQAVQTLLTKTNETANQNNILTNNFTSRYNPLSIMNNYTAEAF